MKTKLVYQEIATLITARLNCIKSGNQEWLEKHTERLEDIAKSLPRGSGIDRGTKLDLDKSTGEKIVLNMSFHHMNEGGMYDGWTEHVITVTPSLYFGFNLSISGQDKNQIKEYLYDVYHEALNEEIAIVQPA